jgi:hypothetical protein
MGAVGYFVKLSTSFHQAATINPPDTPPYTHHTGKLTYPLPVHVPLNNILVGGA